MLCSQKRVGDVPVAKLRMKLSPMNTDVFVDLKRIHLVIHIKKFHILAAMFVEELVSDLQIAHTRVK